MRKRSLGHRDRKKAMAAAQEESARLLRGIEDIRSGRVTLARVFAAYEAHRSPRKSAGEQQADGRRIDLWTRFLGGDKDPERVTLSEWERFIDLRSSGAINGRGEPVPDWVEQTGPNGERHRVASRVRVGARTVQADLLWLRLAFRWAVRWRGKDGRYLMRANPVRGYDIPTEKNPRRPVATEERYKVLRQAAEILRVEVGREGRNPERVRTLLPELLDIVNGTGRRISAVCRLTYQDLRLDRNEMRPFGAIRWPADTDKAGRETEVPIGPSVRAALDRVLEQRPGIGRAPIFPSPKDRTCPISRHLADSWLRKAEKLAGLETQEGSLWHAFRRKFATERKGLPAADVARVGGWSTVSMVTEIYQQADEATMLEVVLSGGKVREVGNS